MIGLAGKGKLEKRDAFDFLHHKGKTQSSLWELLGAWQWDYSEWQYKFSLKRRVENPSLAMDLVRLKEGKGEEAEEREGSHQGGGCREEREEGEEGSQGYHEERGQHPLGDFSRGEAGGAGGCCGGLEQEVHCPV